MLVTLVVLLAGVLGTDITIAIILGRRMWHRHCQVTRVEKRHRGGDASSPPRTPPDVRA
jgi:hypothetical protein